MQMMGTLVLCGLVATTAMTSILQASQGLGLSRISIMFLLGSLFSAERSRAMVIGFALYLLGGWAFAFVYFAFFNSIGISTWWFGGMVGFVHGLFLLVCAMPVLPYLHPRMASEHHGVNAMRLLEPPGFLAMNYGYNTPLVVVTAQVVYGAVLGAGLQIQHMMHA